MNSLTRGKEQEISLFSDIATMAEKLQFGWVSVIYHANKHRESAAKKPGLQFDSTIIRRRIFPEVFQLEISEKIFREIAFTPGTNMGIISPDEDEPIEKITLSILESIAKSTYLANRFDKAYEVIFPINSDDGEPGFRNFSDDDALKLIEYSSSIKSIENALKGEKRNHIERLAREQIELVEAQLKAAANTIQ